ARRGSHRKWSRAGPRRPRHFLLRRGDGVARDGGGNPPGIATGLISVVVILVVLAVLHSWQRGDSDGGAAGGEARTAKGAPRQPEIGDDALRFPARHRPRR